MLFKRSIYLLFIVSSFIALMQSPVVGQEEKSGDPVVFTCDGEPVTQSKVLKEIDNLVNQNRSRINQQELFQKNTVLFKPAVDRIISHRMIAKAAKEENIEIKQEEIDQQIESLIQQFSTKENLENTLAQKGMTIESYKEILLIQKQMAAVLKAKNGDPKPSTDGDAKKFYDENIESFKQDDQVRASHILLNADTKTPAEEKEKIKKQLEQIAADIKSGKITFADAAKQHSQCPSAPNGGDLDYFGKGIMAKPFEDTAFSIPKGEMSGIVETQFGFHIIQVTDKKEAGTAPFDEVKKEIKDYLTELNRNKEMEDFLQKARDEADIVMKISEAEWNEMYTVKIPVQIEQK